MITEAAQVPTTNGARYLQQLCKHWSHKLTVELSDDEGFVHFPNAVARMRSSTEALSVQVEAADDDTVQRMKKVMAEHLDRFAFREAPLHFEWVRSPQE